MLLLHSSHQPSIKTSTTRPQAPSPPYPLLMTQKEKKRLKLGGSTYKGAGEVSNTTISIYLLTFRIFYVRLPFLFACLSRLQFFSVCLVSCYPCSCGKMKKYIYFFGFLVYLGFAALFKFIHCAALGGYTTSLH